MGSVSLKPQSIGASQLLGQNGLNAILPRPKISHNRRKIQTRIEAASVALAGSVRLN